MVRQEEGLPGLPPSPNLPCSRRAVAHGCMCCFHTHDDVPLTSSFLARWEEERYTDGVKWKFLEHKGPVFAPLYEPLPNHVKFYYDGSDLSCASWGFVFGCVLVQF